jgi:hypothetical protein
MMETCLINGKWFASHFLKETSDIKRAIYYLVDQSTFKKKENRDIKRIRVSSMKPVKEDISTLSKISL